MNTNYIVTVECPQVAKPTKMMLAQKVSLGLGEEAVFQHVRSSFWQAKNCVASSMSMDESGKLLVRCSGAHLVNSFDSPITQPAVWGNNNIVSSGDVVCTGWSPYGASVSIRTGGSIAVGRGAIISGCTDVETHGSYHRLGGRGGIINGTPVPPGYYHTGQDGIPHAVDRAVFEKNTQ